MTYGYVRVSTQEQGSSGLGMDAQRFAINYAARGHVDEWFEDVASGVAANRPGFDRMLAALKPGDRLYVSQLDRLTRDLGYFVSDLVPLFLKKEVRLVVAGMEAQLDNPDSVGGLLYNMVGAYLERMRASHRTKLALAELKARDPDALKKPHQATSTEAVARIMELHRNGHGPQEIARRLTDEAVRTAKGGPWWPGTVAYLIAKHKEAS